MRTVGIITYHYNNNYGTMLQAYALQRVIEMLGYQSEIIDFREDNTPNKLQLLRIRIRRLPVYIMEYKKYSTLSKSRNLFATRNQDFEAFYQKNLKVGNKRYNSSKQLIEYPPKYDGYVVGSDQTWNPFVANNPEAFYLTFVRDDKKKGSYSPSIAISSLTEKHKKMFQERLAGFRFLSCRESLGTKLLADTLNREVVNTLDPSLLLDWGEWETVSARTDIKEPYILTYFLGDIMEHRVFVEKLARKTGLKVVCIPKSYLDINNIAFEKRWVGPDEFLDLVKNAKYVCTDSFHGTMFSINFGVKFFAFCKTKDVEESSENSRLYSALDLFGLSSRLVTPKNENYLIRELPEIDFKEVQKILKNEKEKSITYLNEMLSAITE